MPAFGFSIGDIVSAIDLASKVVKALRESSGAASEYQRLTGTLRQLDSARLRSALDLLRGTLGDGDAFALITGRRGYSAGTDSENTGGLV
ncbi:MAG: hypothetical protein M1827_004767 [Pycnora praestabilis]|nr:MAG: hypothetical protein M1827_004767 [Pycnora praestabilis]